MNIEATNWLEMSARKPQTSVGRPISINNLEGYLRIHNTLIRSAEAAESLCHKDHKYKQSMLLDKISKMRFTSLPTS